MLLTRRAGGGCRIVKWTGDQQTTRDTTPSFTCVAGAMDNAHQRLWMVGADAFTGTVRVEERAASILSLGQVSHISTSDMDAALAVAVSSTHVYVAGILDLKPVLYLVAKSSSGMLSRMHSVSSIGLSLGVETTSSHYFWVRNMCGLSPVPLCGVCCVVLCVLLLCVVLCCVVCCVQA